MAFGFFAATVMFLVGEARVQFCAALTGY